MADIPLIGFKREDAQPSGEIRTDLAEKRTPIGPYTHNTSVRGQKCVCRAGRCDTANGSIIEGKLSC
jgi:hypothetical protein